MSDYPKGLRFDIYERFTLSDEVAGISELEDIELTPRITMQTHEEQALLSGDLLLTGTYVGVGEQSRSEQLSHQIPVEITLPLKRIKRMDHIGIEIENFDVELLSNRSMNITGVICLNGIDTSAEQTWQQTGETVFVHEAGAEADTVSTPERAEEQEAATMEDGASRSTQAEEDEQASMMNLAEDSTSITEEARSEELNVPDSNVQAESVSHEQPAEQEDEATIVSVRPSDNRETVSVSSMLAEEQRDSGDQLRLHAYQSERVEPVQAEPEIKQEPIVTPSSVEPPQPIAKPSAESNKQPIVEDNQPPLTISSQEQLKGQMIESTSANEAMEANIEPNITPQQVEMNETIAQEVLEANEPLIEPSVQQETKEMKIAFGSNKQQTDEWSGSAAGVKSLLHQSADQTQQQDQHREEEVAANAEDQDAAKSMEESVQWKNLLLTAEQEEQRFSKMRMCIVQKEETLEGIAMRYSLNPKEIVLYNRMESDHVHEGQVIYIPRKK